MIVFAVLSTPISLLVKKTDTFSFHFLPTRSGLRGVVNLWVAAKVHSHLCMMITLLCLCLIALRCVVALGTLQSLKDGPSPPEDIVPKTPKPLGNAAVWQQAVALDTATHLNGTNQYIYSEIAWWQSLENSNYSYTVGSSAIGGPSVSQLLQQLQIYPIRFDQAQASEPKQTPSK